LLTTKKILRQIHTNSSVHSIDTSIKDHFHKPFANYLVFKRVHSLLVPEYSTVYTTHSQKFKEWKSKI